MSDLTISEADAKDAKTPRLLRLIPAGVFVLSLPAGAYRAYLLYTAIEPSTGLYTAAGSVGGVIFFCVLALLAVCCIAAGFYARKHPPVRPVKNEAVVTAFAATVLALMFAALFFTGLFRLFGSRPLNIFLLIETVLCVPSALYFWHVCVSGNRKPEGDYPDPSVLPLFPAVFVGVCTVERFIDVTRQINASERSFEMFTLVCLMMFFVSEARFYAPLRESEKTSAVKAKNAGVYYAYALLVTVTVAAVILPYMLVSAFWLYDASDILYHVLYACIGLYALARAFVF